MILEELIFVFVLLLGGYHLLKRLQFSFALRHVIEPDMHLFVVFEIILIIEEAADLEYDELRILRVERLVSIVL